MEEKAKQSCWWVREMVEDKLMWEGVWVEREVFHFEGVEEAAREEGAKHVAARSIWGCERSSTSFRIHCFLNTENSNCTSQTHLQSKNRTTRNTKKLLQAERLLKPQP